MKKKSISSDSRSSPAYDRTINSCRKEQVNLGLGVIGVPTTKNRKPRIVHLSEEAKDILRRQMARHLESPWIFPGTMKKHRPLNARWWYNKRFRPACERAGIEVDEDTPTVARVAAYIRQPHGESPVQRESDYGSGGLV